MKDTETEFLDFVDRIATAGIAGAKESYQRPDQRNKLEGSIEGFEACRGKNVLGLTKLLAQAAKRTEKARAAAGGDNDYAKYWRVRCYEIEVEWLCNVVSAALMNQGLPTIIPPTARGMIQAANILGVARDPSAPLEAAR